MRLIELTGRESGVVLWEDEEGLLKDGYVCNWSNIDGLPRRFTEGASALIGMKDGDDLEPGLLTDREMRWAKFLAEEEGDSTPLVVGVWRNKNAVIITFKGWN